MKQLLFNETAPIGLGLRLQVGIFGPQLFGAYAKPLGLYYGVCAFLLCGILASMHLLQGGTNGVLR
jgi:hypothetical protein